MRLKHQTGAWRRQLSDYHVRPHLSVSARGNTTPVTPDTLRDELAFRRDTRMWSSLINWAQRQIWQESHDTVAIPPLPFLPPPLSRGENGTSQDVTSTVPAPHNGTFFERLSPDLRRMILIEAFGDRTIHIDLRYDRPLKARPPRKIMHAGGVDVLAQGHSTYRQTRQPRAWQWYSCVCHRDPESFVERWQGAGEGAMASHPAKDTCLRRRPQSCDFPPGDTGDMSRCFLGVMGWLMTCRQA